MTTNKTPGQIALDLTEAEARALELLSQYGAHVIINTLRKSIPESSISGMGPGLKSLFDRIRADMPSQLTRINATREIWSKP